MPVIVNCYGIAAISRFARLLVDRTVESYIRKTEDKACLKRLGKAASQTARAALERISEVKFADFSVKLRDKNTEEDSLIEEAMQYIESPGLNGLNMGAITQCEPAIKIGRLWERT